MVIVFGILLPYRLIKQLKITIMQFKNFTLALALAFSSLGFAQENQNLFNRSSDANWGFFLGSSIGAQIMPLAPTAVWGVQAGAVLNHNFRFGGSFYHQLNDPIVSLNSGDFEQDLNMGGLYLEYVLAPSKLIHLSFPLEVGAGEIGLDERGPSSTYLYQEDLIFYLMPGARAELNLHENVRLQAGVQYRMIFDANLPQLTDSDLSGINVNLGLVVGLF